MTGLRPTTELARRGPAAAIVLTDEQVATLGPARTPPVRVTIGGVTVPVRIGRMGGENLVGLNKAVRARKEHARSVADAKRDDTRARRVAAVVAALRES